MVQRKERTEEEWRWDIVTVTDRKGRFYAMQQGQVKKREENITW